MLLAFSSLPEELEVLLVSVTYGNIDVQNCLRNVVSLFFNIEKEISWREQHGRPRGFDTLRRHKPLVAIGPDHPLADQILMADFFRKFRWATIKYYADQSEDGRDGLGDIHSSVGY